MTIGSVGDHVPRCDHLHLHLAESMRVMDVEVTDLQSDVIESMTE